MFVDGSVHKGTPDATPVVKTFPTAGRFEFYCSIHGDLNAQTGNLSPLVAAGICYLILTVPLTHLVNFIDARLRRGRAKLDPEDPAEVVTSTIGTEMT